MIYLAQKAQIGLFITKYLLAIKISSLQKNNLSKSPKPSKNLRLSSKK